MTTSIKRAGRTSLGFGLLISACVSALVFAAPASAGPRPTAHTTTRTSASSAPLNGIIRGRVLFGKTPQPGLVVTLLGVPNSGDNVSSTATTDPSGTYVFTKLSTGTNWSYSVSGRFKGALFSSDQVSLRSGESRQLNLAVFDTTISPAKVTLGAYAIWIDYTGRKIAVQQDLQLKNAGTAAYIGTTNVTLNGDATPAAIALPLSPGAANLQYLGRFGTCCSVNNGTEWWHTRPIAPGTSQGTMRYEAPIPKSLAFAIPFETATVAVLVPKSVSVDIPGLKYVGTKSDTGTTYAVYQGGHMSTGAVLTVVLGKAPRNWAMLVWIIVPIVLILGAIVIWLIVRQRKSARAAAEAAAAAAAAKPKGKKKQPKPAKEAEPVVPTEAPKAAAPTATAAPVQPASGQSWSELADQLARLDLAYESGSLTDESTYRKLREALVQKLVAATPPA